MSRSRRRLAGASLSLALLLPMAAFAQVSSRPAEQAILNLEDQFLQSRVTGDISAAKAGFADDGVFIHENGDERTKAAYFEEAQLQSHWLGVDKSQRVVHVYGDAAVTHAVIVRKLGAKQTVTLRTTVVYAKQSGKWRIVSWQDTPLIDTHPSPAKP